MPLIDTTYFESPILIAQLGQPAVDEAVTDCIAQNETVFLDKILGVSFSEAFINGLDVVDPEVPEQRWTDLLTGTTFINSHSRTVRFGGIVPADKTKVSPLAAFIYWMYQRDQAIKTGGIGYLQPEAENAKAVDATLKTNAAWNIMLRSVHALWNFLSVKGDVYPEYDVNEVDKAFFGVYLKNWAGI